MLRLMHIAGGVWGVAVDLHTRVTWRSSSSPLHETLQVLGSTQAAGARGGAARRALGAARHQGACRLIPSSTLVLWTPVVQRLMLICACTQRLSNLEPLTTPNRRCFTCPTSTTTPGLAPRHRWRRRGPLQPSDRTCWGRWLARRASLHLHLILRAAPNFFDALDEN